MLYGTTKLPLLFPKSTSYIEKIGINFAKLCSLKHLVILYWLYQINF